MDSSHIIAHNNFNIVLKYIFIYHILNKNYFSINNAYMIYSGSAVRETFWRYI